MVIGYLVLVPLGYLLWKTFVADGTLTLDNFRRAYSAVGLGEMTVNSLWFTAGTTAVAVTLGTALAYLVVRTDLPWKPLVVALTMTQLDRPRRPLHDRLDLPGEPAHRRAEQRSWSRCSGPALSTCSAWAG